MNAKPIKTSKRGQGMTEYILIVCLVSIASIGIITLYGDNVRRLFAMSADSLAGEENVSQANRATAVGNQRILKRTMKEFAWNNTPY